MATFADLMTIMREDYLSDTFDGYNTATQEERDENVLWKDRQLLRFLVEAQEEACMRGELIYTDDNPVDIIEGEAKYTVSPIMLQINKVIYQNKEVIHIAKSDLERLHPDWRTQSGIGTNQAYYYMTGYTFNIFPTPSATDVATDPEIHLEGYRLPTENLVEADDLEIPLFMHKNVMWHALHAAYGMADADALNYKESQVYLTKFDMAFGPKIDNRIIMHQLEQPKEAWVGGVDYIGTNIGSAQSVWHS